MNFFFLRNVLPLGPVRPARFVLNALEPKHLNYTNLILYSKRNKRMNSILDIKIFLRFGQGSHKCFFCRLETFVDF